MADGLIKLLSRHSCDILFLSTTYRLIMRLISWWIKCSRLKHNRESLRHHETAFFQKWRCWKKRGNSLRKPSCLRYQSNDFFLHRRQTCRVYGVPPVNFSCCSLFPCSHQFYSIPPASYPILMQTNTIYSVHLTRQSLSLEYRGIWATRSKPTRS